MHVQAAFAEASEHFLTSEQLESAHMGPDEAMNALDVLPQPKCVASIPKSLSS